MKKVYMIQLGEDDNYVVYSLDKQVGEQRFKELLRLHTEVHIVDFDDLGEDIKKQLNSTDKSTVVDNIYGTDLKL